MDPLATRQRHRRNIGIFACAFGVTPPELRLVLVAAVVASDARAGGNTLALNKFGCRRAFCSGPKMQRAWQLATCEGPYARTLDLPRN